MATIPPLDHTVGLVFWHLLPLTFLGVLLDAPGCTARESLLPDLATAAGMTLERTNGASGTTIASLFVTGVAAGALNPLAGTVLQERIPAELRGRVLGAFLATVLVAAPLGVLLTGALIETVGLRPLLLAQGIACFAITLSIAANPAFRELDGEARGP